MVLHGDRRQAGHDRLSEAGLGFAYGLYTAFAAIAFVFVLKSVNETKGKELESMV